MTLPLIALHTIYLFLEENRAMVKICTSIILKKKKVTLTECCIILFQAMNRDNPDIPGRKYYYLSLLDENYYYFRKYCSRLLKRNRRDPGKLLILKKAFRIFPTLTQKFIELFLKDNPETFIIRNPGNLTLVKRNIDLEDPRYFYPDFLLEQVKLALQQPEFQDSTNQKLLDSLQKVLEYRD
jgi:hypothetical protein